MTKNSYLSIFLDKDVPSFLTKYLYSNTLLRLLKITQFCGCDYTRLYTPLFKYTRYDHSIVVANMTWHFSQNRNETIKALFHDAGTPCFAHTIDYVFGDYIKQESAEKSIKEFAKNDPYLIRCLKEDGIELEELDDYSNCHVLENESPSLCTDRLDGVLHTVGIWLHTNSFEEIEDVYKHIIVLHNEVNTPEIGFDSITSAEMFCKMILIYAKELQGNKDKYIMKYISEIIKRLNEQGLISYDDLYKLSEKQLIEIIKKNIESWNIFQNATIINSSDDKPCNEFYISFETKKRNVIPLVFYNGQVRRINEVSTIANEIYSEFNTYADKKYGYIRELKKL